MARPAVTAVVELLKPITWFAPMWAFGCGVVSAGAFAVDAPATAFGVGTGALLLLGIVLAGPLVCATSQAVNDWYDRFVDAINEPQRPIPSGRIPGRWGLHIAIAWTALSAAVATVLGPWGFGAAVIGLLLAWAYSAPPLRLKRSGWLGNSACALCYEGLPWFTGAAIVAAALPDWRVMTLAVLYSAGAHGIMTLNDFKSIDGDRQMRIRSLPVQLGTDRAARVACVIMIAPQLAVVGLLLAWGAPWHGTTIGLLTVVQLRLMARLLHSPRERAAWYNATGTSVYVLGMLVSAFALRSLSLP
jgi:chlorophyll/bacteriochlorophyll a synthase